MVKMYSDLDVMNLKSLYDAERVSNRLLNNETAFRDHIIQVCFPFMKFTASILKKTIHKCVKMCHCQWLIGEYCVSLLPVAFYKMLFSAIIKYTETWFLLQHSWWLPLKTCGIESDSNLRKGFEFRWLDSDGSNRFWERFFSQTFDRLSRMVTRKVKSNL